jgi:hypothetical protein
MGCLPHIKHRLTWAYRDSRERQKSHQVFTPLRLISEGGYSFGITGV